MNSETSQSQSSQPLSPSGAISIVVAGLGGAGCNALGSIAREPLAGVRFLAAHSNQRELEIATVTEDRFLLGAELTRGVGTGGDPELGQAIAEKEFEALKTRFHRTDLVIIVAGLGGGTGGGAGPVFAKAAKEAGALVLGLVTLPFKFEGARREAQANEALIQLRAVADAVICLPNEKFLGLLDVRPNLKKTFDASNQMLAEAVGSLWQMLARPGFMNVTFADLCSVLRGGHMDSVFATAQARGENRAQQLIDQLAAHPLLDQGKAIRTSDSILINITGGPELALDDVQLLMNYFNRESENPRIVVGAAAIDASAGVLSVTVISCKRTEVVESRLNPANPISISDTPLLLDDSEANPSQVFFRGVTLPKSSPRYVAPPPDMTEDQKQDLLQQRGGTRGGRSGKRWRQEQLPLQIISKGRFEKSEPTLHRGQDLDVPTYIRRGIAFN